jgi:hypothetical protein
MNLDYARGYLAHYLADASDNARRALITLIAAMDATMDRNRQLEAEVRNLRLQLEAERS